MFIYINRKLSPRPFELMAEHRSILKNNQNTYYPLFNFTSKAVKNSVQHIILDVWYVLNRSPAEKLKEMIDRNEYRF